MQLINKFKPCYLEKERKIRQATSQTNHKKRKTQTHKIRNDKGDSH